MTNNPAKNALEQLHSLKSSTSSAYKKVAGAIPELLENALKPIVEIVEKLSEHITSYERQIERLSREKYSKTEILTQVNGGRSDPNWADCSGRNQVGEAA